MTDNDKKMFDKGYRFKLTPTDHSFEPLYVKALHECGPLMRSYPNNRFDSVRLVGEGTLPLSFNEWFDSLEPGRQAVLREDKWMLAKAAFEAGQNSVKTPT